MKILANTGSTKKQVVIKRVSDGRLVVASEYNANFAIARGEATLVTERPVTIINRFGKPEVIND